jgi:hypothetical protein
MWLRNIGARVLRFPRFGRFSPSVFFRSIKNISRFANDFSSATTFAIDVPADVPRLRRWFGGTCGDDQSVGHWLKLTDGGSDGGGDNGKNSGDSKHVERGNDDKFDRGDYDRNCEYGNATWIWWRALREALGGRRVGVDMRSWQRS